MPKYDERIEFSRSRARGSSNAEHWGAAIAGAALFALPAGAFLFRGSLGWMEVVVALIGVAGLAVAADSFARSSAPEGR